MSKQTNSFDDILLDSAPQPTVYTHSKEKFLRCMKCGTTGMTEEVECCPACGSYDLTEYVPEV